MGRLQWGHTTVPGTKGKLLGFITFNRREIRLIGLLLLAMLVVSFFDVFFQGRTFKISTEVGQALATGVYGQEQNIPPHFLTFGVDAPVYEEPTHHFIKQNLWQGILPLWNPHQALGYPLVAMIQSGMFFPLNYLLYIFPDLYGWDILILVRFFLAGLFTYLFMRSLRYSPASALTAGIAFMLSGPLLLIQNGTANVDILIPLLFLALEYLVQRPGARGSVFVAAVVALMIIAGAPEHVFFNNLCGFFYFCFRVWTKEKRAKLATISGYYLLSYVLAIGLSALALFPFFWNFTREYWNGHPPGMGTLVEENTSRWLSIILPHFFQHEPMSREWQPSGWLGGYLGMLPVLLAGFSLFNRHRRGLNYFFVGLAVLVIAKSYGLWFINWIGYLPLFHMSRYAYHTPPLAAFFVAVAAGMGLRSLFVNKNAFLKGLVISLSLVVIILFHLVKARGADYWPLAQAAILFAFGLIAVWQVFLFVKDQKVFSRKILTWVMVTLVFGELFCYIHRERVARFVTHPTVPYMEFLKQFPERSRTYGLVWTMFPNTATGYGVDDLGIFDGLLMRRYVNFINELVLPNNFVADLRPTTLRVIPMTNAKEYLDLLNLKYLIAPKDMPLPASFQQSDALKSVYRAEADVYERQGALPRAFVVHRVLFEPQEFPSYSSLLYYRHQLDRMITVNSAPLPEIVAQLAATPEQSDSRAQITRYSPNEVRIKADMKFPGFLVLSDIYHPDWCAEVDGQPAKIFETDNLIRSVFLPAGRHEVRFVFRPVSFYWGCLVSVLALVLAVVLLRKKS